jgi:hypothetical protein
VARDRAGWLGALAGALIVVGACSSAEQVQRPTPTTATPAASAGTAAAPTTTEPPPRVDGSVRGEVIGGDGKPAAGRTVTVVRTDTGSPGDGALTALFTFGLACVVDADSCSSAPRVVDSSVTDGSGTYEATLPGAYQPGYETDDDWVVTTTRPAAPGQRTAAVSSFEFEVNAPVQEAPALPLWDAAPTIRPTGQVLEIRSDGPPSVAGGALDTSLQVLTEKGELLWDLQASTVDPRVLEDGALQVVGNGRADVRVDHAQGRTIYHQRIASPSVAYQGTAVPLSRSAVCTLEQGAAVGCPLTDGDLLTGTEHEAGVVGVVDLGKAMPVGLVVVRGREQEDTLVVEVSEDATTWRALHTGPLGGAPGVVATAGGDGRTARYLRVTSTNPGSVAEVSAWAPLPRPASGPAGIGAPSSSSDTTRLVLAVVAALLAGLVGGVAVSRRRRA